MSGTVPRLSPSGAGLRTRDVVVMVLVVAAVLAILALGLSAAEGLEAGRARALPDAAPVAPATAVDAGRLVGRWRNRKDGTWLIVTAKGEVWSDSGRMQGRLLPKPGSADVVFGDGRFACRYAVTFQDDRTAEWHLVDGTPGTPCPSGLFTRPLAL